MVAARSAYLQVAFALSALIPDAGGTWILPRLVGQKRALALMWDCPQLSDRAIARQIGVGNKTVSRWRKEATPDQRLRGDELTTQDLCALLAERRLRIQQRRLRRWRQAVFSHWY